MDGEPSVENVDNLAFTQTQLLSYRNSEEPSVYQAMHRRQRLKRSPASRLKFELVSEKSEEN